MSFETDLLDHLGTATDAFDIRAIIRRCFFYDFDGFPLRLWHGEGVLQAGGFEWLGTIDGNGVDHHVAPAVRDSRDGASPRYEFRIPYIDKATFEAFKADQDLARNRYMTCYHALFLRGEGLRPSNSLRFAYRLIMMAPQFSEAFSGEPGSAQIVRSATVLMRSGEYGRSKSPGGTYTDTSQRERARILGVASDSGCAFVAGNQNRTYHVGGD